MHRQPPSLHSTVMDRAIESEPMVYVRLNESIDGSQGAIKLNNNNDQQTLTSYKMPGLLDAAVSLADEDGFLPAYSTVPYTTTSQQVKFTFSVYDI
ncbi:hypothetical protein L9F63_010659 [Diploptera punctata]|uniref:Uncharacterized protein n=1 Tax=Diploptera punctata TaxID=6984 RepID=A0AAD8AGA8_DIPPU|nr:hypothetical protein L9F63_010659 [Diploptera punctata]